MKNISYFIIISILILGVSCHSHEHDENGEHINNKDEHGHAHGEDEVPTISYNTFGNNLELFFESTAFVAGKPSKIIAHFNSISNFKPVRSGKLTIKLENQESKFEVVVTKITRKGIFISELKPEKSGNYKLSFQYELDTLKETIEIEDIIVYQNLDEAIHKAVEIDNANDVVYLKEQMWKTEFESTEIILKDFSQTITAVGEILPAQGEKRIISAKTNGMVLFSAKNLVIGKPVKRGERLFMLSSQVLGSENTNVTFENLKNEFEQCKILYERHKLLNKEKIISTETLNQTYKEYISDSISYFNFLSSFSKNGILVKSQISGFIQTIFVEEGQYVTAGQSLAVVSANSRMMIRADVSLQYYNLINNVSNAIFKIPFNNKTIKLEELEGKIISTSTTVQSEGKYLPIYFEVQNNGSLIEGAYIECFLKIGIIPNQIVIPKTSLIEELGNHYVYVQTNGESFEKRLVKIKSTDGVNISIENGLFKGERVVTKGAMQIKLASLSNGMDSHAGHHH